jgi:hypothetical protein
MSMPFSNGGAGNLDAMEAVQPMAWVIQQLREAMPFGQQPTYLFRDNDRIYGDEVGRFLVGTGIAEVKTPTAAPGKIHSWKGMEAPYGESCWIT